MHDVDRLQILRNQREHFTHMAAELRMMSRPLKLHTASDNERSIADGLTAGADALTALATQATLQIKRLEGGADA